MKKILLFFVIVAIVFVSCSDSDAYVSNTDAVSVIRVFKGGSKVILKEDIYILVDSNYREILYGSSYTEDRYTAIDTYRLSDSGKILVGGSGF